MLSNTAGRLDLRSAILATLSTGLLASLIYSLSLQQGHADVPIAASADLIQPLQAGDDAPRFVVSDVDGKPFRFDPASLDKPTVIITFRGGWCPYCNTHLSELRSVMPQIEAMEVDVLFLSGDRPELLYKSLAQETQADIAGLGYTILSDANAQAAMAFGIAFRASEPERTVRRRKEKGEDIEGSSMLRHGVLPVPAVYVISTDGRITYDFVEPDYRIRLNAGDLLDAVRTTSQ